MKYYSKFFLVTHYGWNNNDLRLVCDNLYYPFLGPTRLAGPNRVRVALMSLNHLIKIIYQKHVVVLHFSWHKILFKYEKAFLKG